MSVLNTFHVNSGFGDPVKGKIDLAISNGNAFYGYYGYGRNGGDRGHTGYDYVVSAGKTDVIAVGAGTIVQVRIGPISTICYTEKDKKYIKDKEPFKCPQLESIKNNSFSEGICINCPGKDKYQPDNPKNLEGKYHAISSTCFGVQVWLKLDEGDHLYAFYAHLSKLSPAIVELTRKCFNGDTTIELKNKNSTHTDPRKVKRNDLVGISGRTGNASGGTWPDHLHFECRKSTGNETPETRTQISPNNIVKTKFLVTKDLESVFDEKYDTEKWSTIKGNLQTKWKSIFNVIETWKKAKSYHQEYAPQSTLSISETEPIPIETPFKAYPIEQSVFRYETITRHANYNIEVFFPKNKNSNNPIAPYQIIKKTMDSYHEERGVEYIHNIEEYDNEICMDQTNQMPWQQVTNH